MDYTRARDIRDLLDLSQIADLEPAERTQRLLENVEDIKQRAFARKNTYINKQGEPIEMDRPDFRAALGAIRLAAELTGAIVSKHEITAKLDFQDWSEPELEAYAIAGTLPARLRELPPAPDESLSDP